MHLTLHRRRRSPPPPPLSLSRKQLLRHFMIPIFRFVSSLSSSTFPVCISHKKSLIILIITTDHDLRGIPLRLV